MYAVLLHIAQGGAVYDCNVYISSIPFILCYTVMHTWQYVVECGLNDEQTEKKNILLPFNQVSEARSALSSLQAAAHQLE